MAKPKGPKDLDDSADNQSAATATEVPVDVSVPVEAGAVVSTDGKTKKEPKPGIPEHLKKGNRVCAACGTTEAEFMAKNPRYSLCFGVDVLCYRKGHRVLHGSTLDEINAKYPDKVGKNDDKGLPLISEVSGIGIKPGILVRGAISYKKAAVDTAVPAGTAPAAVGEATGSAGTTSAG